MVACVEDCGLLRGEVVDNCTASWTFENEFYNRGFLMSDGYTTLFLKVNAQSFVGLVPSSFE